MTADELQALRRDDIALEAMKILLGNCKEPLYPVVLRGIAVSSYQLADEMMAALWCDAVLPVGVTVTVGSPSPPAVRIQKTLQRDRIVPVVMTPLPISPQDARVCAGVTLAFADEPTMHNKMSLALCVGTTGTIVPVVPKIGDPTVLIVAAMGTRRD